MTLYLMDSLKPLCYLPCMSMFPNYCPRLNSYSNDGTSQSQNSDSLLSYPFSADFCLRNPLLVRSQHWIYWQRLAKLMQKRPSLEISPNSAGKPLLDTPMTVKLRGCLACEVAKSVQAQEKNWQVWALFILETLKTSFFYNENSPFCMPLNKSLARTIVQAVCSIIVQPIMLWVMCNVNVKVFLQL